jgi:hypothetical protein
MKAKERERERKGEKRMTENSKKEIQIDRQRGREGGGPVWGKER